MPRSRASLAQLLILALALAALAACAAPAAPQPTTPAPPTPVTPATSTPTRLATPTPAVLATPAPPTPSSSPSPLRATPTKAAQPTASIGYLEGRVMIGPLVPGPERVGVPTPSPPPEACTARSLTIYEADGKTEVTSVNLQPDCTYRVALKPGPYVVGLKPGRGIEHSKDLPKTIQIESGKTVRLDVSIDTGIR